jgi:signal transduction histidine kinase
LLNLLDNAIKYTIAGQITVALTQHDKTILLSVSDTGCGIAQDELFLIFDRFYRHNHTTRSNTSGFGLGLAICKWIVEAHRGEISATSQLGQGSKFTISIPFNN